MNVEGAKAALVGLEGKLAAAKDRRDKIIIEISRTSAQAAAIGGIGDQGAKISLGPLNKQAAAVDSEIASLGSRFPKRSAGWNWRKRIPRA